MYQLVHKSLNLCFLRCTIHVTPKICALYLDRCEVRLRDRNEAGGRRPYEPLPHLCSDCHWRGGRPFPGSFWQLGWHIRLLVSLRNCGSVCSLWKMYLFDSVSIKKKHFRQASEKSAVRASRLLNDAAFCYKQSNRSVVRLSLASFDDAVNSEKCRL